MDALLERVAGADDLTGSIELLVAAAARAVILDGGRGSSENTVPAAVCDCGVVVRQAGRPSARHGTSARVAALLDLPVTETGPGPDAGPVAEVLTGGPPVVVLQGAADIRWPGYSSRLADAGFGSMLAVRLRLRPDASAAVVFFVTDAAAFPLPAIAAARAFAVRAGSSLQLAIDLHNAGALVSDVLTALDSRRAISTACGLLMARNGCSYGQAFSLLAREAGQRNVRLLQVAGEILAGQLGTRALSHP